MDILRYLTPVVVVVSWMNTWLECRVLACVLVAVASMSEARGGPYLRSNLARSMYNRMLADERLRTMNLTKVGPSTFIVYILIDYSTFSLGTNP